ncbi:MAG: SHOCT domain-containing protein [Actinomycetota bacterium]
MNWGNGGWWMMLFWGPVLVIALVGMVIWAVRSTSEGGGGSTAAGVDPLDGARRILAERYARGELDSEQYRDRLERLG